MVRPIDVQDNLAKTPGAERVNQIQKAAPDIDQRQAAQVVQSEQVQKQREARQPERTDEVVIHCDKQEKEESSGKDNKKEKKARKSRSAVWT
ncbi:MAG: hypothetical protein KAT58_03305 [candidate division Zixibacteria bacterium]|nr:hypothetical protein [candidate division Zixibacteria bacterium]